MASRNPWRAYRLKRKRGPVQAILWTLVGLAVIAGTLAAAGLAGGLHLYNNYAAEYVDPESLSVNQPYAGAKIYDRNGEFLYEFVDENNGLRRPVEFDEIAPIMIAATVATEDATFFQNSGLNVRGLARAAWENLLPLASGEEAAFEGSGGSSISQQLAKNLYIPEEQRYERSIDRKVKEAVLALELNKRYSKEQIITWYLNQINYGGMFYGVEAAAQGYFGKHASELTLAEAALLAGIPQSPGAYEPTTQPDAALKRRNQVLELMRHRGAIDVGHGNVITVTNAEIDAALAQPLDVHIHEYQLSAPHFVFSQVKPQLEALVGPEGLLQDGLHVTTTIDMNLQREAQVIMERWVQEFEDISNSRNGAFIVIDPRTGEIKAYSGSRDYYRDDIDGRNDNLIGLNSPGSSFKPFVYLTTFMELGWSPGTVILDVPRPYREDDGTVFVPTNPVRHSGPITIRNALGNSLNIPPFNAAMAVGVNKIVETAKRLGFSTLTRQYGPSIAIGGVDLTALDLAYGYSILANNGLKRGIALDPEHPDKVVPAAILSIKDGKGNEVFSLEKSRAEVQVVPPGYAFMITSILTDPGAQCITFGCGGLRVPSYNVAVKTGTSEPYDPKGPDRGKIGDTWAFGYTRDLVVGIWAGNANNAPITNIFSTSISYRSMRDIMVAAYDNWPQTPYEQPPGVFHGTRCSTASIGIGCRNDLLYNPEAGGDPARQGQAGNQAAPPQPTPTQAPRDNDRDDREDDDDCDDDDEREREREEAEERREREEEREREDEAQRQGGGDIEAAITSPGGGAVSGTILINGTASSPSMTGYTLEYQAPDGSWQSIGSWSRPIVGGALGGWRPGAPGTYTIRLTVFDANLGARTSTVTVTVQ